MNKTIIQWHTKYVIIIGDEEGSSNVLTIKNNETKEEFKINVLEIVDFFDEQIEEEHHD